MNRVIIESPYAATVSAVPLLHRMFPSYYRCRSIRRNLRYLRACMRDCLQRRESPYASHGLYTQPGVLNDDRMIERNTGPFGSAWRSVADKTVVYTDLGTSAGMRYGIADAKKYNRPIEYRTLGPYWEARAKQVLKQCPGLGW